MKKLMMLIPLLALSGCASLFESNTLGSDQVAVEKVESRLAKIGYVTLTPTESGLRIRGKVQRKLPGRGAIPGHLHIDALGKSDHMLASIISSYMRPNTHSRYAKFSKELSVDSATVRTVRVTHHRNQHTH